MRVPASLGATIFWVQMFFWFRIFDSLAQYVDLIFQTAFEIRNFMFVLVSLLFMFGSGLYLIQINRMSPHVQDSQIYNFDGETDKSLFFYSMFRQYFILLGDFGDMQLSRETDELSGLPFVFANLENILAKLYFVGSTFFTQIVVLNMLIAIMSSTFDRHQTDLEANAKRQKLILQAEYSKLVHFYKQVLCKCRRQKTFEKQPSRYLVLMTPKASNEQDEDNDDHNEE